MLPTVEKLASEVAKAIQQPGQTATIKMATEGTKAAGKLASNSIKSDITVQQAVADFKSRNVVNSEDIAFACALVDILYGNVLEIRINNVPLRSSAPDDKSVPAAFLFFGPAAAEAADKDLDRTIARLKAARTCFADIFPACVAAITAKEYMDLKALAGKFSSMMIADGILIKEAIDKCRWGVEVCDTGLNRANTYDATIQKWIGGSAPHNH